MSMKNLCDEVEIKKNLSTAASLAHHSPTATVAGLKRNVVYEASVYSPRNKLQSRGNLVPPPQRTFDAKANNGSACEISH